MKKCIKEDCVKNVHLIHNDKFTEPYIEFINNNFESKEHLFLVLGKGIGARITPRENVIQLPKSIKMIKSLIFEMHKANKILLHGLFSLHLVILLFMQPWLLKKCYWVLWGGDLYTYQLSKRNLKWKIKEFFRRPVIKNIGYITTTVPGDYEHAKSWYNTRAVYIENIIYPSHIARDAETLICEENKDGLVFIQLGNSADPSNNHNEIIDKIAALNKKNYKVFCPLSYGDRRYASSVMEYGKKVLGERFIPITEFMSFDRYNKYMASIDIAIFNHDRQQAMGNIIGLLSLGKKVYLKSSVTPYKYFLKRGIKLFALEGSIKLDLISKEDANENKKIVKDFFNSNNLKKAWNEVFDG